MFTYLDDLLSNLKVRILCILYSLVRCFHSIIYFETHYDCAFYNCDLIVIFLKILKTCFKIKI